MQITVACTETPPASRTGILAWLRGKPGRDGKAAEPGVEAKAMQAITAAMEGVELLAK